MSFISHSSYLLIIIIINIPNSSTIAISFTPKVYIVETMPISICNKLYFLFESGHLAQYLNGGFDPYKIYTSCLSNFMVLGKILLQSNKIKCTRVNL